MSQPRETSEIAAMLSRMVRAYGKRLADGDPSDLARAVELSAQLERTIGEAVAAARAEHGWSWAELAAELGITRSAAAQRYARYCSSSAA